MALLLLAGCGSRSAKVTIKFDQYGGDNAFAATVYAQEVATGRTTPFPYGPHTPSITIELEPPGRYVFYARLVEAADEYHYGYTHESPTAYGHGARGGTQDPATSSLIGLEIRPGQTFRVYINDYWAILPEPGKPVTVPWRPK